MATNKKETKPEETNLKLGWWDKHQIKNQIKEITRTIEIIDNERNIQKLAILRERAIKYIKRINEIISIEIDGTEIKEQQIEQLPTNKIIEILKNCITLYAEAIGMSKERMEEIKVNQKVEEDED